MRLSRPLPPLPCNCISIKLNSCPTRIEADVMKEWTPVSSSLRGTDVHKFQRLLVLLSFRHYQNIRFRLLQRSCRLCYQSQRIEKFNKLGFVFKNNHYRSRWSNTKVDGEFSLNIHVAAHQSLPNGTVSLPSRSSFAELRT